MPTHRIVSKLKHCGYCEKPHTMKNYGCLVAIGCTFILMKSVHHLARMMSAKPAADQLAMPSLTSASMIDHVDRVAL